MRIVRTITSGINHDGLMALQTSHQTGFHVVLYKEEQEVLRAEVSVPDYRETLHIAGIHLVMQTLRDHNIDIDWDTVSAVNDKFRKEDLARDFPTSDIAEYAVKGLRQSLVEIRQMPTDKIHDEFCKAILGNVIYVEIRQGEELGNYISNLKPIEGPKVAPQ